MTRTRGGSPKARNLGAELRKVRTDAGFNQRDLAQKLEVPRPRLQRWENGTTVPSTAEVSAFLAICGVVNGPERDRLVELVEDVGAGGWITSDITGVRTELTTLIEFERTCTSVLNVSPLLVPGLLQTAGYVRAIMTGTKMDEVDKRVGIRLGRQEVITRRKNALPYVAIIGEWALREPMGGPDVMAEQLRRIAELSERPNIEVHILPQGFTTAHPAHMGSFVLFEFAKAAPIVHLEHYGSAAFLDATKEVAAYQRAGDLLRNAALSESDSRALIAEIATAMEKDDSE
ncbi:helix-turn-helix transcriptional regulator [Saccharopolyspora shandongensis]|uniref:helix-turn-helix domain-containing protein n=1 Tax=Saccharopolyspora shandongensis TaxID=418495 RepID=UPI0033E734C5